MPDNGVLSVKKERLSLSPLKSRHAVGSLTRPPSFANKQGQMLSLMHTGGGGGRGVADGNKQESR